MPGGIGNMISFFFNYCFFIIICFYGRRSVKDVYKQIEVCPSGS